MALVIAGAIIMALGFSLGFIFAMVVATTVKNSENDDG